MKETTKLFVVNTINCAFAVKQAKAEGRFVNVMRPSIWGNPFVVGRDGTRTEVIALYRAYVLASADLMNAIGDLTNKLLGCACLPLPCHAEVLAELANRVLLRRADGDRRHMLCKCFRCGLVARCTPELDFWDSDKLIGDDRLACDACFNGLLIGNGAPTIKVLKKEAQA